MYQLKCVFPPFLIYIALKYIIFPWQQWKAYPNWFPFMYLIQGTLLSEDNILLILPAAANDTVGAWKNLTPQGTIQNPTPPLPFPYLHIVNCYHYYHLVTKRYINTEGLIVGYPPGLVRTNALFLIATHPNASLFS